MTDADDRGSWGAATATVSPPPSDPGPRPFDKVFSAFTLAAVPLAMLIVMVRRYVPITDPDTFGHLRLGEYLLETWRFSGPEPWSSLATRRLVLHGWAPEVVYALAYRISGWGALSWLQAVGAVALIGVLYACARQFAEPLVASFAALGAFLAASGAIALRPQIISLMLVASVTVVWLRCAQDGRPRWWLVPLTWLWACIHGLWLAGIVVGGATVIGMWLDKRVTLKESVRLVGVLLLSVGAAGLTPAGPQLLLTARNMRAYTPSVAEWATPSVFDPQTATALGLAGLVLLVWLRAGERPPWTLVTLVGLGVLCCVTYTRTVAVGAAILCVVVAKVMGRTVSVAPARSPSHRMERRVLAGALVIPLLVPLLAVNPVDQPADVPSNLSSSLDRLPHDSVVFNEYRLGGWLLWAHPDLDPVIDGRADVYDIDYFNRVVATYSVAQGWDAVVEDTGADAAVLRSASPLATALHERLHWQVVAEDQGYVLLTPPV